MKFAKKIKKTINVENIIAVLFAVLILFEFKMEEEIRMFMNTTVGLILSFVLLIVFFMTFNPFVALLFLIYIYDNIKFDNIQSGLLDKYTKHNVFNKLINSDIKDKTEKDIEIGIIQEKAPIVKKSLPSKIYSPYSCNCKKSSYQFI